MLPMLDALTQEDIDFHDATEDALMSAGFDIATLGLGKGVKAAWVLGKKALGHTLKKPLNLS